VKTNIVFAIFSSCLLIIISAADLHAEEIPLPGGAPYTEEEPIAPPIAPVEPPPEEVITQETSTPAEESTAFNLSLFPPISIFKTRTIEGLDLGILSTQSRKVIGWQFSPFYCETDSFYGLQLALVCNSRHVYGCQAGLLVSVADRCAFQFGMVTVTKNCYYGQVSIITSISKNSYYGQISLLVNVAETCYYNQVGLVSISRDFYGFQSGLLFNRSENVYGFQNSCLNIAKSCNGIQVFLINIAEDCKGIQLGLGNFYGFPNGLLNFAKNCQGVQISAFNISKNCKGLQLGLVNYCETLKGAQIGVINIITKGNRFIPVTIGLNVGW
jgi:hypothetical protein